MLDVREQAFVHEYIINNGNAFQAAKKAGYKDKTANHAYQWLKDDTEVNRRSRTLPYKPALAAAIKEELAKIQSQKIATEKEILEYLTSVMRRQQEDNVVVMARTEGTKYVTDPITKEKHRQTVKREEPQTVKFPAKLSDSNKAAELLGKTYGIFTDRLDIDGDMDLNIKISYGDEDEC